MRCIYILGGVAIVCDYPHPALYSLLHKYNVTNPQWRIISLASGYIKTGRTSNKYPLSTTINTDLTSRFLTSLGINKVVNKTSSLTILIFEALVDIGVGAHLSDRFFSHIDQGWCLVSHIREVLDQHMNKTFQGRLLQRYPSKLLKIMNSITSPVDIECVCTKNMSEMR